MPIDSPPAWTIRPAEPADEAVLFTLLPELATFPLPPRRMAKHLWSGDAALAGLMGPEALAILPGPVVRAIPMPR